MKTLLVTSAAAFVCALGTRAQNTNIVIPPGKLAVFKAGDSTGTYNISTSRVQPCFVQVFDPVTNDQAAPLYSLALPTNAPNAIWINAHAGSEGGGISRAANREVLALEGYTGNILSPTNAKPSSDLAVTRGFGILDAFGNEQVLYSDLANWFGLPPGVTQNNPTGIATADGTNFWGTGNVTGTSSEAAGTLFYNAQESSTPIELQNYVQAAAEARIINGTLYVVVPGGGIYDFLDPNNNDAVVPLPYDPDVPNPVEHIVLTNLFLNWGATYKNIANFDMNPAGTIAYGADQTYGIVKFVNTNGIWQPAPYYFNTTNIGASEQVKATQGCFGICVDFNGPNPVIYATTMETGTAPPNNSQGNPNQNRIIRIVDSGDPGTNLVAQTLATANTTNEVFRGIDFAPDLTPLITSVPAGYSTTNGGSATFTIAAQSVYPLTYQWLQNGTILSGDTNASVSLINLSTNSNGDMFQCVVSNEYGVETSAPPALLTVSLTAEVPAITNAAANVTAYVNGQVTFAAISPTGTEPFTFQWYYGGASLTDGVKYAGSAGPSLTISNLLISDSGSYYLVASNAAGFASNLVDVLAVGYHVASITAGEPQSVTTFVGLSASLTATQAGGTPPLTYQWYNSNAPLSDVNEFSGSGTETLTINPAGLGDAGSYKLVITNGGGSVTSQVATITVLVPPPHSFLAYSNQIYVQTFDSLPDPGSNSVNSINNPQDPGSIDGISYSLANPFDFAYPVINSSYVGGLGLSNTMPGWYGAADTLYVGVDGITRFGAQDGDQTTGGVIDFGPNDNGGITGTNRALGLLSTGTTGSTTFALKLVNESSGPLTTISLGFIGELWHNGTGSRVMSFGYTLDPTATNFLLTSESITNAVLASNLFFSFPTASVVTAVDGTQPANQIDLATNNMALASSWAPGGALWLIWSINYYGSGGGNGYAIDNFTFSTLSLAPVITAQPQPQSVTVGGSAVFSLSISNAFSAGYQWYTNGVPLSDTNEISGSASNTLTISPAQLSDAATYQVIVTNQFGSVTSTPVTLSVSAASGSLSFTLQPDSQTNYVGSNTLFTALAAGTPPLGYQWQFDGTNISGATTNSLSVTNLAYTNAGTYTIVATNASGTNSASAVLTVLPAPPSITTQPTPQVVTLGSTAVFSVGSGGTAPFTYQWLAGATALNDVNGFYGTGTSTLTISNVLFSDAGSYSVVVSNSSGSATSLVATLTVVPAPSYLAYTNAGAIYTQNFDSLPYTPGASVNSANPVTLNSVVYSLGNPFDFAFPVASTGTNGLGLSNTMPGWYGLGYTVAQLGAHPGDNTTGGDISFGPTNTPTAAANRSLGLLATSKTGATSFGLRVLNLTSNTISQFSLSYTSELWRQTATAKTVTNYYYINGTGMGGFVTNVFTGSLTNLAFTPGTSTIYGTNGPVASSSIVLTGQSVNWPPGAALWLVWTMQNAAGSGQGIGIDDLFFSTPGPGVPVQLNIVDLAGNAVVWWASSGGTNLQVTQDLTLPWVSAGLPVTSSNLTNSVTVPIGAANQFFRLMQQ